VLQFGHVAEGTRAKRQLPYIFFAEGVHLGEVEFRVLWVFEVGEVVAAQDHVLRRDGDRTAVGRRQDVVAGQHEDAGLGLRLHGERQVEAIWSPSKSALKAVHTSGCSWMALPSMSLGSKA